MLETADIQLDEAVAASNACATTSTSTRRSWRNSKRRLARLHDLARKHRVPLAELAAHAARPSPPNSRPCAAPANAANAC